MPTVFIDTFYDVLDATFVNMNNEDAVFQVLSHFKGRKFRRIGFVASHVEWRNRAAICPGLLTRRGRRPAAVSQSQDISPCQSEHGIGEVAGGA